MSGALPYQEEGVSFLAERTAALLADEPGLGKTFQAIRACDARRVLKVLVICPASVIGTWYGEVAKFREGDWDVRVTSFERACGREYEDLLADEYDVIVIDEAHFLKALTSKRTRLIYGFSDEDGLERISALVDRAGAVWLLTGTPMPNNPSELYPHLRALAEDTIRSERNGRVWSIHQFINGYCITKHNGFGISVVGAKNEAKLHSKLKDFMLRRKKSEVLKDLPPLTFGEVMVDGDLSAIPPEEIELVKEALDKGGFDALKDVIGHVGTLRRLTGMAKVPAVNAWLKDWLASSTGKIVVFAFHKDVIADIAKPLGKVAVTLAGSSTQAQREHAVTAFQNDPKVRVFIGQIQAAGTGITLTAASNLLFVESSFVPADMEQATMRIHRISQTEPCLARLAVIPNSIDEAVQRALVRKMRMIDAVVDGKM